MKLSLGFLLFVGITAAGLSQTTVQNTTYPTGTTNVSGPSTIYASTAVLVPSGANVTYTADSSITLDDGFVADEGCTFTAQLTNEGSSSAPAIVTQPVNRNVSVGATVTFSVTATGNAPLNYQWRKEGAPISGATVSSLTLANVQLTAAGSYDVVVSNSIGTVTSNGATLTVTSFDPNADDDGDGVANGVEVALGLNPFDPTDVNVHRFTYNKVNELESGPGGQYVKDPEGNIKQVKQ